MNHPRTNYCKYAITNTYVYITPFSLRRKKLCNINTRHPHQKNLEQISALFLKLDLFISKWSNLTKWVSKFTPKCIHEIDPRRWGYEGRVYQLALKWKKNLEELTFVFVEQKMERKPIFSLFLSLIQTYIFVVWFWSSMRIGQE